MTPAILALTAACMFFVGASSLAYESIALWQRHRQRGLLDLAAIGGVSAAVSLVAMYLIAVGRVL